jgi:hypothetical protein
MTGSADGWKGCNGVWCSATATSVSVGWSIGDGSSTFDQIFGIYYGGGEFVCPGEKVPLTVYAGPGNPSGIATVSMHTTCTIGYGVPWNWAAGMCDTSDDCYWNTARGPHISWNWSPPGGSAFNFYYYW